VEERPQRHSRNIFGTRFAGRTLENFGSRPLVCPLIDLDIRSHKKARDQRGISRSSMRYAPFARLGLGIAVVYATWMYLPSLRTYAKLVQDSERLSQQANATQRRLPLVNPALPRLPPANATQRVSPPVNTAQGSKLSATGLEIALQREPQFRPESQLHCKKATRGWDYTCSYMPTPLLSPARLQFGARVDATSWVELSRVVPAGTIIPRPRKRIPGDTRP